VARRLYCLTPRMQKSLDTFFKKRPAETDVVSPTKIHHPVLAGASSQKDQPTDIPATPPSSRPLPPLVNGLQDPLWRKALEPEFRKLSFRHLCEFLESEARAGHTIFPPMELVWTAFNLCPPDRVKVCNFVRSKDSAHISTLMRVGGDCWTRSVPLTKVCGSWGGVD
jgi:hypothetical protein